MSNTHIVTSQVYSTSNMREACLTVPTPKSKENFWTGAFVQTCVITYGGVNPSAETFRGKFNFTIATTPHSCSTTLLNSRIRNLIITDEFLRTVFVVVDGLVLYDMGIIGTETINDLKAIVS